MAKVRSVRYLQFTKKELSKLGFERNVDFRCPQSGKVVSVRFIKRTKPTDFLLKFTNTALSLNQVEPDAPVYMYVVSVVDAHKVAILASTNRMELCTGRK